MGVRTEYDEEENQCLFKVFDLFWSQKVTAVETLSLWKEKFKKIACFTWLAGVCGSSF